MPDLKGTQRMKVALISAYSMMDQRLKELAAYENMDIINIVADFEKAKKEALKIESSVDAILARASTFDLIKDELSVPVVSLRISPFDLIVLLSPLSQKVDKIAFFNYKYELPGIKEIEKILRIGIVQFTFLDYDDIKRSMQTVVKDGLKVIVGGGSVGKLATEMGLTAIEITAGYEEIRKTLKEAASLVKIQRKERISQTRLKIALNSMSEGISVSDENKKIVLCNPATERIFDLKAESEIGNDAVKLRMGEKLGKSYASHKPELNYLQKINESTININHIPINYNSHFVGVVSTYQDVTKIQQLETQIRLKLHEKGFYAKYTFEDILTQSPQIRDLIKLATLYSQTDSSILIEGESGTGKELLAQSIHNASLRKTGPFVAINCAALPENLLESELFGYVEGAFTGARKGGKPGLFELAHNGTLFLDEIADIPKNIQSRLLRVLQEKEIMRIGDEKIISVNCRVISATNKNLYSIVKQGDFRDDLYYRLCVFHLNIPSLRERKEDILLLFRYFLNEINISADFPDNHTFKSFKDLLLKYGWPGNIRELQNIAERCRVLLSEEIDKKDTDNLLLINTISQPIKKATNTLSVEIDLTRTMKENIEIIEKEIIFKMMELYDGNKSTVANHLNIGRTSLWRKLSGNPQDGNDETDD